MDAVSYSHSAKQAQRIEKFIANPDSASGIVTVPRTIAAGETVTIPAGRVAVLPNVKVDGEVVVEAGGEIFIPAGATLSKVVELKGNQDIDGIKTFLKSPIVPVPTLGSQAVNKDYVDSTKVALTGNQTIAGVKTFSSSPIVPTPTTNTQATNKAYVDSIITNAPSLPIGVILNGYTIFDNCIVAFGGEFNRADYPKLWDYLLANPTLLKTKAQWQTESTANGGICGFYSDGNGTTTFRVPNLNKAFLRPDSRAVGSYQADAFKSHTHSVTALIEIQAPQGTETGKLAFYGYGGSRSTTAAGETETIPKNIAVLPLIVAK